MSDNGESGGDTINDLLATNEVFSEIVSEASSHREATTDLPAGFAAMVALMTEGVKTAVQEALRANREDAAATLGSAAGPARTRRATMLAAHDSAEVVYMRSDQREFSHKMTTIREGNVTALSERGGYSAHDLQFGTHDQPYFTYGWVLLLYLPWLYYVYNCGTYIYQSNKKCVSRYSALGQSQRAE